jgi:hypothetical protein
MNESLPMYFYGTTLLKSLLQRSKILKKIDGKCGNLRAKKSAKPNLLYIVYCASGCVYHYYQFASLQDVTYSTCT